MKLRVRLIAAAAAAIAIGTTTAVSLTPANAAGGTPTVQTDIPYFTDQSTGNVQKLDAYLPATTPSTPGPAVVFIHEGGWGWGDKADDASMANWMVTNTGWPTFAINYELASPSPLWNEYWDIANAVAFIKAHAADYGVDPNRIAVIGGSSAGTEAAGLAFFTPPSQPQYRVKAAVTLSGIFDFPLVAKDAGCLTVSCPIAGRWWGAGALQYNLLKTSYAASPSTWTNNSPVAMVDKTDTTALYLAQSTNEILPTDQLQSLTGKLAATGLPYEAHLVAGTNHGDPLFWTLDQSIVSFLQANL